MISRSLLGIAKILKIYWNGIEVKMPNFEWKSEVFLATKCEMTGGKQLHCYRKDPRFILHDSDMDLCLDLGLDPGSITGMENLFPWTSFAASDLINN
jgi:hypothetical protein